MDKETSDLINVTTNNGSDSKDSEDNRDSTFFLPVRVAKRRSQVLKIRLQTLISSKGLSEADFYKSLGLNKSYWYKISWGITECPLDLKIRISQALNVDSATIWRGNE